MASEGGKSEAASTFPEPQAPVWPTERQRTQETPAQRTDTGMVLRIKPYLPTSSPAWPDIVEAADWLRHDLGVSKLLWGDACLAMGREQAAIALAIVSAKPAGHFTSTPGGYFNGMVTRAKVGTLNLSRTVWGLRANQQPGNVGKNQPRNVN